MKKNLLLLPLLLLIGLVAIEAQIVTPAPSPGATVMQKVGLSDVTVEYSRPAAKGRTIFAADGLVPFGKIWRTGANQATTILFSDEVTVGGKSLPAGKYAILTKPGANTWVVQFYHFEESGFNTYVEKLPTATATAKIVKLNQAVESFTIGLDHVIAGGAHLQFSWDKTMASVPLEFAVESKVLASIDAVMAGPSNNDYYNAASYYHDAGKDLGKALEWINMATAGDSPRYWQVRRKSLILADMGKKKEAIAAAKLSLILATKAGNEDYIKMNSDSLKEWSAK